MTNTKIVGNTLKNISKDISNRTKLTVSIIIGRESITFTSSIMALHVFKSPFRMILAKLTSSEIEPYCETKKKQNNFTVRVYHQIQTHSNQLTVDVMRVL